MALELSGHRPLNQRIVGEIHLDEFEVTHQKDNILWFGDDEDEVQDKLAQACADLIAIARQTRKGTEDSRGPSDLEIQTAVQEIQAELTSAELVDLFQVESVPPPSVVAQGFLPLLDTVEGEAPDFSATVGDIAVVGFLADDSSPNDPYFFVDAKSDKRISVVINMRHPYIRRLTGDGTVTHFRHCVYDALAEYQARHMAANLDPDTIKALKDRLLRLSFTMEMHEGAAEAG